LILHSIDQLAGNMTLLTIAHRLSAIVKVDMICVLKQDRVVENVSYYDLLQTNDYTYSNGEKPIGAYNMNSDIYATGVLLKRMKSICEALLDLKILLLKHRSTLQVQYIKTQ